MRKEQRGMREEGTGVRPHSRERGAVGVGGPPPAQEPALGGRRRAAGQPHSAPSGLGHATAGQEQPRGEGTGTAEPSPGLRCGTPHTLGSLSGRHGADPGRPASPTQHSQEKTEVCGARGDSERCLGAGRPQTSLRTFPVSCGLAAVQPERQDRGGDLHRECSREALQCGHGRNKRGVLKPSEIGAAPGRASGPSRLPPGNPTQPATQTRASLGKSFPSCGRRVIPRGRDTLA